MEIVELMEIEDRLIARHRVSAPTTTNQPPSPLRSPRSKGPPLDLKQRGAHRGHPTAAFDVPHLRPRR
jgi:hypothetical protein